jgi:hypothetical protein
MALAHPDKRMSPAPAMLQHVHPKFSVSGSEQSPEFASEILPGEDEVWLPTLSYISLKSLAVAYGILLNSLAVTLAAHIELPSEDIDAEAMRRRRREVCAAVWAANRAALGASNLSALERGLMNNMVWRRLVLHWQSFCGIDESGSAWLESRSAAYLPAQTRMNPVATASHIIKRLFQATGATERRQFAHHSRALASLVGQRILSEVTHINELKSQFRFV